MPFEAAAAAASHSLIRVRTGSMHLQIYAGVSIDNNETEACSRCDNRRAIGPTYPQTNTYNKCTRSVDPHLISKWSHTYRSVVDLTSSRFHRPHVSWRAVEANSRKLMINSTPIGPKKYVKISMSPVRPEFVYDGDEDGYQYCENMASSRCATGGVASQN